ncbi:MAG: TonB-dependent receptor [Thiobacillus sp.]|nr:TonB-dependent receptor [Gammaproteobacteria bacterium]MDP1924443.1 TonB-dependent receptor [Thiobacillus sp.]
MMASRQSRWSSLLLTALLGASNAGADGFTDSFADTRYRIQGFAAQTLISSTNNNFSGDSRDSISTNFTELGLHGFWLPLDSLQLSGQVLYRRAGGSDQDGLRLDYAQADWRFYQNDSTQLGVKLGKVKIPYGLYNETRDVPFTRPSILLPQAIYLDTSRSVLIAAPGAIFHGSTANTYGNFDVTLGWARPDFDSEAVEDVFLGNNRPGNLDGTSAFSTSLRWDTPTDTTFMLTYIDAKADYEPASVDYLSPGSIRVRNLLASVQQRFDTVTLTAEYNEPRNSRSGLGAALPDTARDSLSYYLQAEWRFHPEWELVVRNEINHRDKDDKDGTRLQAARGLPAHLLYTDDWVVGLRWDVTPNLMLRAEYHHVNGTSWLPGLDNPDIFATEQRWNMGLLQAAYRF